MAGRERLYSEAEKNKQLSSYIYVPAKEKTNPDNVVKLRIKSAVACNHEDSICPGYLPKDDNSLATYGKKGRVSCIESWEGDWEILFDRTSGGRTLRATYVNGKD